MTEQPDPLVVVEKGLDCANKALECAQELGHFLGPIIKAPLETAAGIANDWLRFLQWERQQRYMQRVNEIIAARNLSIPTRAVPLNIAIPILQAASMEEDDQLQDIWARLLVNAMDAESGIVMRRAFIDILENMTSLDARLLALICEGCGDNAQRSVPSRELEARLITDGVLAAGNVNSSGPISDVSKRRDDSYAISLLNLLRLGCIRDEVFLSSADGSVSFPAITPLGVALVKACSE